MTRPADHRVVLDALGHVRLLLLPVLLGFLPADDPRVVATVGAIADTLTEDGLVLRYRTDGPSTDGLTGREGTFVLCTFWLVRALAQRGETDRATALFDRTVSLCNDVGLLSEEYDTTGERMLGNVPQAVSHIGLLTAARALLDASACTERVPSRTDPCGREGSAPVTGFPGRAGRTSEDGR